MPKLGIDKETGLNLDNVDKNFDRVYNIPERYKNTRLKDPEKYGLFNENAIITGKAGAGKTHLMFGLMRYHALRNISALGWCTEYQIESKLKENMNTNERTESDIISDYLGKQVLFIDDFGVEYLSPWFLRILNILINERYNKMRPTIVTTNLSVDDLMDRVGDRIVSRLISDGNIIELVGKDKRVEKHIK